MLSAFIIAVWLFYLLQTVVKLMKGTVIPHLLYWRHEMAVGVDGRGGETSRYMLTRKLLSIYQAPGKYWNAKTRAVNICEIGILSWRARCACAIISPSRLHTIAVFSWRDNSTLLCLMSNVLIWERFISISSDFQMTHNKTFMAAYLQI